jgi:hypothetical protein
MSADTTPTPEGWERRETWLHRQHKGRFAAITCDEDGDWGGAVLNDDGNTINDWYPTLEQAINWANDQLGVPKPVEIHEREFADGSVLVWREDGNASARVSLSPYNQKWFVDGVDEDYPTKEQALSAAREYVRGGS